MLISSSTASERATIIKAMDHLESKTCIRFRERTDERDFIEIYPGGGYVYFYDNVAHDPHTFLN